MPEHAQDRRDHAQHSKLETIFRLGHSMQDYCNLQESQSLALLLQHRYGGSAADNQLKDS